MIQTLVRIQKRKIVEALGDIGMGLAEELFVQRQRLLVERFGLAVASLRSIQFREIVEALGDIGMGLAEAIAPAV